MGDFEELLIYCHLEDMKDDPVVMRDLRAAAAAAEDVLRNTICPRTSENARRWDLCHKALTLHYYDHRGLVEDKALAPIPLGVRQLMTELKLTSGCLL